MDASGGAGYHGGDPSRRQCRAPARPPALKLTPTEWRISALMTTVQLVGVVSFMIVMPLGPDFTRDLGIAPDLVGWVMAAYTVSSAASALVSALVIDRFDRRPALAVALAGLVLSNVAAGLAWNLESLMAARLMAGLFGGPAAALSIAVVADNVPLERRGQAMGMVMGAISIGSVVGIPLGLEIAHYFSWRVAFHAVAGFGAVLVIGSIALLPAQRLHLADVLADTSHPLLRLVRIGARRTSLLALALAAVAIIPGFMVMTNLAVFIQFNLGFPREQLGLLYMIGGVVSFFGMRWTGRLVDRFGSSPVTMATTVGMGATLWFIFVDRSWLVLPVMLLVPMTMMFNTARIVAQNTAVSKVPEPAERAGFMALVNATTQISGGIGALASALLLGSTAEGRLLNMPLVAMLAIGISLAGPLLMWRLERIIPGGAAASHRVKAAATRASAPPG